MKVERGAAASAGASLSSQASSRFARAPSSRPPSRASDPYDILATRSRAWPLRDADLRCYTWHARSSGGRIVYTTVSTHLRGLTTLYLWRRSPIFGVHLESCRVAGRNRQSLT